jgi:hypothetical protein
MNSDKQTQLPGVVSNQDALAKLKRNTQGNGSRFPISVMAALGVAVFALGPLAQPSFAYPTMIRLGYVNCAACHIAPQGRAAELLWPRHR